MIAQLLAGATPNAAINSQLGSNRYFFYAASFIIGCAISLSFGTPLLAAIALNMSLLTCTELAYKLFPTNDIKDIMLQATVFYFVSCTGVWFMYYPALTLQSWLSCVIIGSPGYPPSILFLFKSLAGNAIFHYTYQLLVSNIGWKRA